MGGCEREGVLVTPLLPTFTLINTSQIYQVTVVYMTGSRGHLHRPFVSVQIKVHAILATNVCAGV